MRIIAGIYKGRSLETPEGEKIRPTSDRTRESLFNLLMHGRYSGDAIRDHHVVDVCCGTGALGLEALSRGAARVTLIDRDPASIALAKRNAAKLGATDRVTFLATDATNLSPTTTPAALVLFDAPYDLPLLAPTYRALRAGNWFAPGALLVAEQRRDAPLLTLEGAEILETRQYGKTVLVVYQVGA